MDSCDLPAAPVTITYTWIVDNTPPQIATTATSGDLGCNPTVTAPTFTVTDNCSVTDPIDVQTTGATATAGCGWTQSWKIGRAAGRGRVACQVAVETPSKQQKNCTAAACSDTR